MPIHVSLLRIDSSTESVIVGDDKYQTQSKCVLMRRGAIYRARLQTRMFPVMSRRLYDSVLIELFPRGHPTLVRHKSSDHPFNGGVYSLEIRELLVLMLKKNRNSEMKCLRAISDRAIHFVPTR